MFNFAIRSDQIPENQLELSLNASELVNGYISVWMTVTGAEILGGSQLQLKCAKGGNAFFPCMYYG